MRKTSAILLLVLMLTVFVSVCWADEEKDHVCFRALDSNQDNLVTLQEFEKYYSGEEAKFKDADADKDAVLTHDEYHDLLGHGSS